jgi:serine/threonine protein kinase
MDKFKIGKKLFPNIYELRDNCNIIVKKYKNIKKKKDEEKRLLYIRHIPNVSHILYSTNDCIYMKRIPGEDLITILMRRVFTETEVRDITYKLLQIIKNIHSIGFIHGDIKLENIMYDEVSKNISLIDFETGKYTSIYQSPESFSNNEDTIEMDIWSIGITVYILLMRRFPYDKDDTSDNLSVLMKNKGISSEAINFVGKLLMFNPKFRPSIEECLNHQWFDSNKSVQNNFTKSIYRVKSEPIKRIKKLSKKSIEINQCLTVNRICLVQ